MYIHVRVYIYMAGTPGWLAWLPGFGLAVGWGGKFVTV